VRINGRLVERGQYAQKVVNDGDVVEIIHLMSGG